MSEREQQLHIRERFLQYTSPFGPQPETPMANQPTFTTGYDTPAYNPEIQHVTQTVVKDTPEEDLAVKAKKEFDAVKAGLILLIALLLSGAFIMWALSRFIG